MLMRYVELNKTNPCFCENLFCISWQRWIYIGQGVFALLMLKSGGPIDLFEIIIQEGEAFELVCNKCIGRYVFKGIGFNHNFGTLALYCNVFKTGLL